MPPLTPFFLLRMWLKRAPAANRAAAGIAMVVILALVAWIAVPGSGSSNGSRLVTSQQGGGASSGSAAGSSSAIGPTSSAGSGAIGLAGSSSSTSGVAEATGGEGPAGGNAATTQACQKGAPAIKLGIILPDVGSGSVSLNGFLGVPSVQQEQAFYNAVIGTINAAGGVQCHALVGEFQAFNELDSSNAQTICLKFAQDKVFAVLGGFEPGAPDTCLLQNNLPTFEQIMISTADAAKYYPYYFSTNGAFEVILKNFVNAVARLGYFGPGKNFKKFGVLLRNCIPSEQPALMAALAANGVSSAQVDTYDFGCRSSLLADPANEISQAEFQFWKDGVTAVTAIDGATDLQGFTNDANQQQRVQHWKPYYLVPDDGGFATLSATQNVPNGAQFDGAIGITGLQYGGIEAGLPESAATVKCDAIMTSHGLPTVYKSGDQFAGSPCDLLWMLTDAMNQDPGLSPTGLAAGLGKVASVDMAYPDGPNSFRGSDVTWGGEYWRQDVFFASCRCFRAVDANFNPSF